MAITSESKWRLPVQFRSTHFYYALTYVVVTFVVLVFLNVYCAQISQELFYNSKKTSMIEKSHMVASEIANLNTLNTTTVSNAVSEITSLRVDRLIVTDNIGIVVYDSEPSTPIIGKYAIFPEIADALAINNVFTWSYSEGAMRSNAATPVMQYGTLTGCVYISETDSAQGALIDSLQNNIFIITMILEIVVFLFSIVFSTIFTKRLRRIMTSIRVIRAGDYSHKLQMGGRDELTVLGNEFNELTLKLQSSENQRRQFVSDASHELKTPLASIKLLTDSILHNDMDMNTVREFVSDIGTEADRLNKMSQKLLTLSKSEIYEDEEYEITYIAPTVERVLRMLRTIADEHNIEIVVNLENDCPILIVVDDLYQILFNLVENGIKYNTPNGKLFITLNRDEDNAIIRIEDTGVGIPEESLGSIFERFYRVDKARSRKSGGSGLGLSIVRGLVQKNRGEITVSSKEGKGSVFTVTFPSFDTEEDEG